MSKEKRIERYLEDVRYDFGFALRSNRDQTYGTFSYRCDAKVTPFAFNPIQMMQDAVQKVQEVAENLTSTYNKI